MRTRAGATLLAALIAATACSDGSPSSGAAVVRSTQNTVPTTAEHAADPTSSSPRTSRPETTEEVPETTPIEPAELEWAEYNNDVDVAVLSVPVDYSDPTGDQFDLYVARHRALDPDNRIGTLLVNPGGPGRGGVDYAISASQLLDVELLERFDIVAWDPRGTGQSVPSIDCIDDYDQYFTAVDSTPDDAAARAALVDVAEQFAAACVENNPGIVEHVGTNNSARDMDAIRRALGEDTISFLGFSYGSELGAVWATLFPDTVRAAVFDGAADPGADELAGIVQQMAGFEAALNTFFDRCADADACAFHHDGDPRQAYLELLASLDAQPIEVDPARPPVNRDVALVATVQAMYSDLYWDAFERALASAQFGDATGLMQLHDGYFRRQPDGTYPNFLEAFQVITCADRADRTSVEDADAAVAELRAAAPTLVPEGSTGSYFCTFFPPAIEPRAEVTGAGAGPIVVIATTGDPATPFASTVAMVETLEDGRLVIVEADRHLGYGVNDCVVEVVNRYLVDLDVPANGTECT